MEYKDKLKDYVDRAFKDLPQTEMVQNTKDELIADLESRYEERIAEGHSPENAYHTTIGSIGDIFELVDHLAEQMAGEEKQPEVPKTNSSTLENLFGGKRLVYVLFLVIGVLVVFLLMALMGGPGPRGLGHFHLHRETIFFLIGLILIVVLGIFVVNRENDGKDRKKMMETLRNYALLVAGVLFILVLLKELVD